MQEILIGPVRAVLGSKLAAELNEASTSNCHFHSQSDFIDDKTQNNFEIDAVSWDINLISSNNVAYQQAILSVDIALSLLRIILLSRSGYGMLPIYGDKEVASGVRHDRKSFAIYQKEGVFSSERVGIPPHYKITIEDADYLSEERIKSKISQIFGATTGSVAERIKRGLGWLAKARQVNDQAERLLYFSTSIETILTSSDKDAKVNEIIARNG